jgi:hypothetical protein
VFDAGACDIVRRHWGKPTLHDERRFALADSIRFLHLPAMKPLLTSRMSDEAIESTLRWTDRFPRSWARYLLGATSLVVNARRG